MADDAKFTQADLDAAIQKAIGPLNDKIEAADAKNAGLLDDLKKAQREARAAKDITPEAHQAEVERADVAEKALAEANKQVKALAAERDKAVEAKTASETAAQNFAITAEIASQVASHRVVPELADAFKSHHRQNFTAEVVDGTYVVKSKDGKAPADYFKAALDGDAGKPWIQALANGGGGAPGGGGSGGGKNPFAKESFNMTEQTALYKADPAKARQLAEAAGVKLAE